MTGLRNCASHSLACETFEVIHDRVGSQAGSVDSNRIFGGSKWIDDAGLVASITLANLPQDVVERFGLLVTFEQFAMPSSGSFFGIGGDVKLALGIREDGGPLIAPFGDDVPSVRELTLSSGQFATHRRV